MKTKITLKAIAFCIITYSVALLSSCSTSSQLSSQHPHYHLNLVKADKHHLPSDKKNNETTTSEIASVPQQGSLALYQPDNQPKELNELLKTDMKVLTRQVKKSNPEVYRNIKTINVTKALRQLTTNNSKVSGNNILSITKTADNGGGGGGRYLGLWLTFLIIAVVFFVFALIIPILSIFGLISLIASAIFFILWILSLA